MSDTSPSAERVAAFLERIPYARFLGIEACSDGEALAVMRFSDDLVGNVTLPALHGGVLGSFLETAAIVALLDDTESQALPKTIDITIDYLRSGQPLDTFVTASVLKRGRRVSNVRAEAWQQRRDKPIAAAHGHFLMPP